MGIVAPPRRPAVFELRNHSVALSLSTRRRFCRFPCRRLSATLPPHLDYFRAFVQAAGPVEWYLVKWRGMSFLHVSWELARDLEVWIIPFFFFFFFFSSFFLLFS